MRDSPAVLELYQDPSAGGMHLVGHAGPARLVTINVQAWLVRIRAPDRGRECAFGDDHSGGRALGVELGHELRWCAVYSRAGPRHRSYRDSIG
jgi:hypothetical protein